MHHSQIFHPNLMNFVQPSMTAIITPKQFAFILQSANPYKHNTIFPQFGMLSVNLVLLFPGNVLLATQTKLNQSASATRVLCVTDESEFIHSSTESMTSSGINYLPVCWGQIHREHDIIRH